MSHLLALRLAALTPEQREQLARVMRDPAMLELVESLAHAQRFQPSLVSRLLDGVA